MRRLSLLFLVSMVITTTLVSKAHCQSVSPSVIASAGDYFVSTNAQLSWTLGEVVTSTLTNGSSIGDF